MSIFTKVRDDVEYPFEHVWDKIKPYFSSDLEPILAAFLGKLATDEGKLILSTAVKYAPDLKTRTFTDVAKEIAKEVIPQSIAIAKQDAEETLAQIQSALQIAKAAANVVTSGDAPAVKAIETVAAANPA